MKLAEFEAEWEKGAGYAEARRKLEPFLALGDSMLAARMRVEMSLGVLSHEAGYSKKYLKRIEAGLANPKMSDLRDIADTLDAKLVVRFEPRNREDIAVEEEE